MDAIANGYLLEQARDHGFIVRERPVGQGYEAAIVCAGSLEHCLAYLKTRVWRGQDEIEA